MIKWYEKNLFIYFFLVMEVSPEEKKNEGNFASCAMRNDAVFCHFFSGDTLSPNKRINSFLNSLTRLV
jgi:hypothetical protein